MMKNSTDLFIHRFHQYLSIYGEVFLFLFLQMNLRAAEAAGLVDRLYKSSSKGECLWWIAGG
jgi:hypothetical protein